jgi:RNA polymerase sigma-70 factor (ECF subfamily)
VFRHVQRSFQRSDAERRSREELLQACARGDQAALQSLYAMAAPQLFGLALGIIRNRELAEDVVQDSFVQAWRHAYRFDPDRGAAMAWLARIVRNRCFDVLRQRGREAPLDDAIMDGWEDPGSGPAELAMVSRDAQRLRDCLDMLEDGPRQSLLLAYYAGLTYEQVGERLRTPLGTVKSWIRRSLVRLKGCMEG